MEKRSDDELIYQRPDHPDWGYEPLVSEDGEFLILHVSKGTDSRNRLFYRKLTSTDGFIELIADLEATYKFLGNDGAVFFLHTNYQSPSGRVISIDTYNSQEVIRRIVIPEADDAIENVIIINNQFIVIYLHHAYHIIKRFSLEGNSLGEIGLPTMGSIFSLDRENYLFGGRDDNEFFFTFNSFSDKYR